VLLHAAGTAAHGHEQSTVGEALAGEVAGAVLVLHLEGNEVTWQRTHPRTVQQPLTPGGAARRAPPRSHTRAICNNN
jgi:hypothetical protein